MDKEIPKISPVVRKWMPEASEEKLIEATTRLRRFLNVAYCIFERLEAEKDAEKRRKTEIEEL